MCVVMWLGKWICAREAIVIMKEKLYLHLYVNLKDMLEHFIASLSIGLQANLVT